VWFVEEYEAIEKVFKSSNGMDYFSLICHDNIQSLSSCSDIDEDVHFYGSMVSMTP
jgi:hypothetical protein